MNWNQVSCGPCWVKNNPDRGLPVRLLEGHQERCSWCGNPTNSGIYVRAHPDTFLFHNLTMTTSLCAEWKM